MLLKNPSVLIIKPSSFGDVIHALPVARAVKLADPGLAVDWVVADNLEPLVAMSPFVDKAIPFRRARWTKWWRPAVWAEISGQIKALRGKEYGAVIDLQGLLRSGLVAIASRGVVKAGFDNAREGATLFYNLKVKTPEGAVHAVDRYMAVLSALGIAHQGPPDCGLVEKEEDAAWAERTLPKTPFAVVNPNSRWATKRWPLERFGQLCRLLQSRFGHGIVIIGGAEDSAAGAALCAMAGPGALDLTGKTSPAMLAAAFRRMEALFTNDSGPLHLAVAAGGRTVSIFGPTDPAKTGPYTGAFPENHIVIRSKRGCSPCFLRQCPYNHECMTDIEPAMVAEAWGARGVMEAQRRG